MEKQKQAKRKQKVFEDKASKAVFMKGAKFLLASLPLLFLSPIVVTIGFKALRKDGTFLVLVLGCFLTALTVVLVAQAFRLILRSLFAK